MLIVYQRSITYRKPRKVEQFQKGAWIHLEQPTGEEIERAAAALQVNTDTLKDALDPHEAPRLEDEKEGVYVFVRYPQSESTVPLLVVVAKEGVLTVVQEKSPVMERFANGEIDFYTTQKSRFLLLVLAEVNRRYASAMSAIRKEANRSKMKPDKMSSQDIVKFVAYESTISDFMDALVPQQAVLSGILAGKTLAVREEDEDVAEDLVLSTNQLIEAGRAALRTMVGVRSAYTAISTERLNTIIRRLTALTVLLTVPTVITSFYGMNVVLPGADAGIAAGAILAFIVVIVGVLIFVLSKNKWL